MDLSITKALAAGMHLLQDVLDCAHALTTMIDKWSNLQPHKKLYFMSIPMSKVVQPTTELNMWRLSTLWAEEWLINSVLNSQFALMSTCIPDQVFWLNTAFIQLLRMAIQSGSYQKHQLWLRTSCYPHDCNYSTAPHFISFATNWSMAHWAAVLVDLQSGEVLIADLLGSPPLPRLLEYINFLFAGCPGTPAFTIATLPTPHQPSTSGSCRVVCVTTIIREVIQQLGITSYAMPAWTHQGATDHHCRWFNDILELLALSLDVSPQTLLIQYTFIF